MKEAQKASSINDFGLEFCPEDRYFAAFPRPLGKKPYTDNDNGGVAERFKALAWKAGIGLNLS